MVNIQKHTSILLASTIKQGKKRQENNLLYFHVTTNTMVKHVTLSTLATCNTEFVSVHNIHIFRSTHLRKVTWIHKVTWIAQLFIHGTLFRLSIRRTHGFVAAVRHTNVLNTRYPHQGLQIGTENRKANCVKQ